MGTALLWAALGTGFTFLMTAVGSASVFLFRGRGSLVLQRVFLGFAAGVMIAASVWSLLIPAIERAEEAGQIGWIPAAGGFVLGVLFLMALHRFLPHQHPDDDAPEGPPTTWGRPMLLFTAVTLHNIPEGMSVGLLFAMSAQNSGDPVLFGMALALALGIGIQNVPEGAAVSLPLMHDGMSAAKAFGMGTLSGLAEPVFGILVVLFASVISPYMPWMLAFSAGAMMYVVVEELIPEAHLGERYNAGTLGVMAGFLVMMILDVALG
ncbi:ZIP family metal transporter [Xiamenia xianingshaonis]|uniref:ZIP family metal transporter n=1 Tax=Xiamenia xianingshaonis TaxID=2682776 RepID=A0A9E6MQW0_9ACTN|nr:ZIP family metal transporter [Xiamenia xianingshaonis]NHM13890.1 ZIP family metal transporter [Xiamenia xianingshaonis]QTU84418.1 ZIP family metal transporter [Xiamenia xianingshaonis]